MPLKISASTKMEILRLSRVSTPRFLAGVLSDWSMIAGAIAFSLYMESFWAYLLSISLIATRQHALMILVHDAAHFRAHRKFRVNDLLSDLLCAYPIFFDTAIYRHTHLQHHEHLNTERDPDWVRKEPLREWFFPRPRGEILQWALGYSFFRGTVEWLYAVRYFSSFTAIKGFTPKRSSQAFKAGFWLTTSAVVFSTHHFALFAAYWLVPFFMIFPMLQRLRSIAEHFGLTYADELNSSREILPSRLEGYLLSPHNVNLHLSHHLYPSVPFFNLKELHRALLKEPVFAQTAKMNSSYVLPGEKSLLTDLFSDEAREQAEIPDRKGPKSLRKIV